MERGMIVTEREYRTFTDPRSVLEFLQGPCGPGLSDRKVRLFTIASWIKHNIPNPPAIHPVTVALKYADNQITLQGARREAKTRTGGGLGHWWLLSEKAVDAAFNVINSHHSTPRIAEYQVNLLHDIAGSPFRPVVLPEAEVCRQPYLNPEVIRLAQSAYDSAWVQCEKCQGRGKVPDGVPYGNISVCEVCKGTGHFGDGMMDENTLMILADALEEAGCEQEALLLHLRGKELCPECLGTREVSDDSGGNVGRVRHCYCGTGWIPLRGPHVRGCWAVDLLLGKT